MIVFSTNGTSGGPAGGRRLAGLAAEPQKRIFSGYIGRYGDIYHIVKSNRCTTVVDRSLRARRPETFQEPEDPNIWRNSLRNSNSHRWTHAYEHSRCFCTAVTIKTVPLVFLDSHGTYSRAYTHTYIKPSRPYAKRSQRDHRFLF